MLIVLLMFVAISTVFALGGFLGRKHLLIGVCLLIILIALALLTHAPGLS